MRDSWRAGVSKTDKTELVTNGIYQISRNPAFLGFDLLYIGTLLMFFNWILCFLTVFAVIMYHCRLSMSKKIFYLPHLEMSICNIRRKFVAILAESDNFKFDGVMDMKIREVNENKKQFISLLLLADEQESMVDRYLEKGNMYVLEDGNVKAECVVTDEGNAILEIKNIAVDPENQGKGYGKALIDFLASKYADEYSEFLYGQL